MKKHLIAAAVAAAVAVPAVAQVTVSGVLDVSAIQNFKITDQATNVAVIRTNPKSSATALNNGWSTSQIVFSGTEDLGGGLKASFTIASALDGGGVFAARDRFIQLAGGFGSVRLGAFVPAAPLGYHGYTQTNLGSAGSLYSLSQANVAGGLQARVQNFGGGVNDIGGGTATRSTTVSNFERNNGNIQYTSPTINGFTANVNFRQAKLDRTDRDGQNEVSQQGVHVQYVAGPLSIGVATNAIKGQAEAVPAVVPGNGFVGIAVAAQRSDKRDLDWIGGQYNFGLATVGFVNINRSGSNTTAAGVTTTVDDLSINAVGVTVPLGALTVRLGAYDGKNDREAGTADDLELAGHQASVTYAVSKRTLAYAVIGETSSKRAGTNVGAGERKVTSSMLGLSHSF